MKRIIATFILLAGVTSMAMADERPITVNSLPKAAIEFINGNFPNVPVVLATVDREIMDTDYEVRLEDGTIIDFDGKGRWVEVSNKRNALPASVLPKPIAAYIKSNYPSDKCLKIEQNSYSYEVKLTNGLEIVFSLDGKMIGYDD
ncbi:MAG: PepSY-like domain-containing protein [Alistipes sp.]|nr:PepSY-like domain-containing protein [Alistipes sp.]